MDRTWSLQINQIFVFRLDLGFFPGNPQFTLPGKHHWSTLLCYRIYFTQVFGKKCDPQTRIVGNQLFITVITVSLNAVLRLNQRMDSVGDSFSTRLFKGTAWPIFIFPFNWKRATAFKQESNRCGANTVTSKRSRSLTFLTLCIYRVRQSWSI